MARKQSYIEYMWTSWPISEDVADDSDRASSSSRLSCPATSAAATDERFCTPLLCSDCCVESKAASDARRYCGSLFSPAFPSRLRSSAAASASSANTPGASVVGVRVFRFARSIAVSRLDTRAVRVGQAGGHARASRPRRAHANVRQHHARAEHGVEAEAVVDCEPR